MLNCSDSEKTKIKEWFTEHSEDGTVGDYMEDMLQDFLTYELASKEELKEEFRLLNESKRSDTESTCLTHSCSERLIELYHMKKEYFLEKDFLEKAERRFDLMFYRPAGLKDFRAYREMCSEEEGNKERTELINTRVDIDKKCELMAEEHMIVEQFEAISEQEKRLSLFNKYGFLLAEDYSEPILQEYCKYVSSLADYARNRSNYEELIRYLRRMQQYKGGNDMVRKLCREWISKYPTRKVMVQELWTMLQ